jgi:type II secretory pathway pseudopilin PulG
VSYVFVLLDVIFAVSMWLVVVVVVVVVVIIIVIAAAAAAAAAAVIVINKSVKYSITVSCTQFSLLRIVHFAYEIRTFCTITGLQQPYAFYGSDPLELSGVLGM